MENSSGQVFLFAYLHAWKTQLLGRGRYGVLVLPVLWNWSNSPCPPIELARDSQRIRQGENLCSDRGLVSLSTFIKDVMVVETNWPVPCPGITLSNRILPISAAGQLKWVAGIRNIVQGLPGGHGLGILYWEPGWVGNSGLGSNCTVR